MIVTVPGGCTGRFGLALDALTYIQCHVHDLLLVQRCSCLLSLFCPGWYTPDCCNCLGLEDRLVLNRKAFQGWKGSSWTSVTTEFMFTSACLHRNIFYLQKLSNFFGGFHFYFHTYCQATWTKICIGSLFRSLKKTATVSIKKKFVMGQLVIFQIL